MSKPAPQAPPARLALVFHAPTVARIELVYRPAAGRLGRALLSWALCWGALPLLIWVPPHYPWVLSAFLAGLYLPYHFWTGRYRVRSFAGFCPRCGRTLSLRPGASIDLPHVLTCFGCHFEPVLELAGGRQREAPPEPTTLHHRTAECGGRWDMDRRDSVAAVVCDSCGARHCATPAARSAAEAENRRGELLEELTREGQFLI